MNKSVITMGLVVGLSACGGGGSGSSESPGSGSTSGINNAVWSNCASFNATSTEDTYAFSGNTFSRAYSTFDNNSCSGTPVTSSETVAGTFSIGVEVTSINGYVSNEIDFQVTHVLGNSVSAYPIYDIFYLANNELMFGSSEGFSLASRPDEIEDGEIYTSN